MAGDARFPSRSFLLYWRADAVSGLGTYVTLLALQMLVVVTLHGSALQVGWLNSVRWLPYLLVGVVVGALVDRRRRLPIMVATDWAQAVLLAVIPLLWWLHLLSFPMLLAIVVLVYGTGSVINGAAAVALLPRLVDPQFLQRAHARTDGTDAAASTAGPALGGLLVSALGAPLAVVVDAATYVYSAITVGRIKAAEPLPQPHRTGVTLGGEMLHGLRWIYRGSGLAGLALATHGWFVGNAIIGVVLAPYALNNLGLTPFQFGLIGAAGGIGALLGASITTRVGLVLGTGRTIIVCHVITTAGVLVMIAADLGLAQWPSVAILAAGQLFYGLAMGMSNSHEMSYRQLVTPDDLQARTNTTMRSINRAVMVLVAPLAGLAADRWGMRPALLVAALVFGLVAAGLAATSFRTVRAPA
ncbi:MAG TPA: MFS transporter [Nocardioidaceae bacterium]|jgi:MFS family permease|nr:MFS transporter [Nocardioidaceae bacterium]